MPERMKAGGSASVLISTASGNYSVGSTVTASVYVNTGGVPINAVEGTVNYSSEYLEFQSVSTSDSIFAFWTRGPIGGGESTTFGGGLSYPGYTGSSGKILTITWKAKKEGSVSVNWSGVRVLANDGEGTNIYGAAYGANFTIGSSRGSTGSSGGGGNG